jgi:hypothetical protein
MKSGLLTTRLYFWIVTISVEPVRQEFFGRAASLGAARSGARLDFGVEYRQVALRNPI